MNTAEEFLQLKQRMQVRRTETLKFRTVNTFVDLHLSRNGNNSYLPQSSNLLFSLDSIRRLLLPSGSLLLRFRKTSLLRLSSTCNLSNRTFPFAPTSEICTRIQGRSCFVGDLQIRLPKISKRNLQLRVQY